MVRCVIPRPAASFDFYAVHGHGCDGACASLRPLPPVRLQMRNEFVNAIVRQVHSSTIDNGNLGGARDELGETLRPFQREKPIAGSPFDAGGYPCPLVSSVDHVD